MSEMGEMNESTMEIRLLTRRVGLPAAPSKDTAELRITIDHQDGTVDEPDRRIVKPGTTDIDVEGTKDTTAVVTVIAVDHDGNESEPVVGTIRFRDDVAPVLVGDVTDLGMIGQRNVPAAVFEDPAVPNQPAAPSPEPEEDGPETDAQEGSEPAQEPVDEEPDSEPAEDGDEPASDAQDDESDPETDDGDETEDDGDPVIV